MVLKSSKDDFIQRAIKTHGDNYSYNSVIYTGSRNRVNILCNSCNQYFLQMPHNHLSGSGCKNCKNINKRLSNSAFIIKANKIHNSKYIYNDQYIKANSKIKIVCPIHGEFEQTPNSHLNGKGCKQCSIILRAEHNTKTNSEFINEANIVHNNKYVYLSDYQNNNSKIKISCSLHGVFIQTPHHHLQGNGCPSCSSTKKITNEEFVEKANLIHNHKYSYKEEYADCKKKLLMVCKIHGEFKQTPDAHINQKQGCPKCSNISKKEQTWLDIKNVKKEYRNYKIILNNRVFKADGFDPDTNTIYEFYGDYWHGNPKIYNENDINFKSKIKFKDLYEKTIDRESVLKSGGYQIISIWENEFDALNKQ